MLMVVSLPIVIILCAACAVLAMFTTVAIMDYYGEAEKEVLRDLLAAERISNRDLRTELLDLKGRMQAVLDEDA